MASKELGGITTWMKSELVKLPDNRAVRTITESVYKAQMGGFSGAKFGRGKILFYNHIDELTIEQKVRELTVTLPIVTDPVLSGGKAIYDDGRVRLEYVMETQKKLKSTIYVASKPEKSMISFGISTTYDVDMNTGLYALVNGDIWLEFSKPEKCVDRDGKPIDVRYDFDYNNQTLNMVIEDIDESRYPIVIDPTVVDNDGQGTGNPLICGNKIVRDSSGNVYVVWEEDGGANCYIYMKKFSSAMVLLQTAKLISPDALGNAIEQRTRATTPYIRIDSSNKIHIAFQGGYNIGLDRQIRYSVCVDVSDITSSANWKIANEQSTGAEWICSPTNYLVSGNSGICIASTGEIFVVYGGYSYITSQYFLGALRHPGAGVGNVWSAITFITSAATIHYYADCDLDSAERIHVISLSNEDGTSYTCRYRKSTNVRDITAWGAGVTVINQGACVNAMTRAIRIRNDKIAVCFMMRTYGIYHNYSNDNGATWAHGTGALSGQLVITLNATGDIGAIGSTIDGVGNVHFIYQKGTDADYRTKAYTFGVGFGAESLIYAQVAYIAYSNVIEKDVPSSSNIAYVMYRDTDAAPDVLYVDTIVVSGVAGAVPYNSTIAFQ